MKKIILILLFLSITVTSCNKEDNTNPNSLEGTHWVKTTDSSRHFTFTSSTECVYVEDKYSYPGTYVFDGSNGTIIETSSNFNLSFNVNGNILSANQDTDDPDFEALYKKQ